MEQSKFRSVSRVLSSLRDLKLTSGRPSKVLETVRRPSKKNVIMGDTLDHDKFYQYFTKIDRKQTQQDTKFILNCLSKHFVFSQLVNDTVVLQDVLRKFFCCTVQGGEFIMRQDDDASSFFVLESGRLGVIINGQNRRQILPGEGFGELALLYNAPRSASLVALEDCVLWGIDRNTFRSVITEVCSNQASENRQFIEKVRFFEYLTLRQKDSVAGVLIQQKYSPGEKIVMQGDPASSFYIIKSGLVRVLVNAQEVNRLGVGASFGEAALVSSSQPRNATVEVVEECVVLALGRQSIRAILGVGIHTIVYRNKIADCLARSRYLSRLDNLSLEKIIDCLVIEKVPKGQEVVTIGQPCREKLFFVLEGNLEKSLSSTEIDIEEADMMHGQRSISADFAQDRYEKTLVFHEDGAIASTSYKQIMEALNASFEELSERHRTSELFLQQNRKHLEELRQTSCCLKLEDLLLIRKLGAGQFGVVYLARHGSSNYALKCVEKSQIVDCKLEKQLLQEKEVLDHSSHPFVLQHCRSFKDERFVYFLTEFINGLELFEVIREMGLLSSKDSRFYIASMLLALEYLHQRNVVYRDLKPQNAIVDGEGYLKLIDMGTCKHMQGKMLGSKTFTIIGTPHYMAPEVLAGKGYSFSCDIWSLGVCLYELMCGFVPFGEDSEDPYEIYEQVIQKQLEFPPYIVDKNVKSLLHQLLSKQQEVRFNGSFNALKNHMWFNGLDWVLFAITKAMLLCKKLDPPYLIPKSKLVDSKTLNTAKGKHIYQELRPPKMSAGKLKKAARKDLDPNWDAIF